MLFSASSVLALVATPFVPAPLAVALSAVNAAGVTAVAATTTSQAAATQAKSPARKANEFVIRAAQLMLGDGTTVENGLLVVRAGKIVAAGAISAPEGLRVLEHDGYLSPGMIACSAQISAPGESLDSTRPFLEDAQLAWGFDPEQASVRAALEHGITSCVLAPIPNTIAGGRTAVVKTSGGELLDEDAHLALSMQASALGNRTAPTSFGGMTAELSARLEAGEGVWGELNSGERPAFVRVDDRHELARALELAKSFGIKGTLVGPSLAGEVLELFQDSGWSLVLPAYEAAQATGRTLASTVAVSKSALPFGYSLGDPLQFRFPAAAALRAGGDRAAIERGFFRNAAQIALVSDRVGELKPGSDADFVLWSADPLALSSHVESVYVAGRRVYEHAHDTAESGR